MRPPTGCPGHESRRPLLALRRFRNSFAKKPPAPPGLGPEVSKTSPRRVTRRAAHAAGEAVLGTPQVSAPGHPPPTFNGAQGLHAEKLPGALTPCPRGPAVRRPVTCAQPGEAGPSRGDPGCFLPHRGRSPGGVPRCSRTFVSFRPRVPGLSRPAPRPGDRRRAPATRWRICALLRDPSKVVGFLSRSLGAIWLHVLVTHQEGCAPRGSRRTDTASARPAQPPSPADRAPPSARPSPAPPPAETPACAHNQGGKTLRRVRWGVPLQSRPGQRIWTARVDSLKCLPPSHAALPARQTSVIFPFPPLTSPIRCRGFLRRRPAPGAPCRPPGSRVSRGSRSSALQRASTSPPAT